MLLKIRDEIIDPNKEPFMLIFENDKERIEFSEQIRDMSPGAKKYCMYPESFTEDEAKKFMELKANEIKINIGE